MRFKPWARMVVPQVFGYFHRPRGCHIDSKYERAYVKGSAAVYVPRNWLCRIFYHDLAGPCPHENGGKRYTCTRCGYTMVWGVIEIKMEREKELPKTVQCYSFYESKERPPR